LNYQTLINEAKTIDDFKKIQTLVAQIAMSGDNGPERTKELQESIQNNITRLQICEIIKQNPQYNDDEVMFAYHRPEIKNNLYKNFSNFREYAEFKNRDPVRSYQSLRDFIPACRSSQRGHIPE